MNVLRSLVIAFTVSAASISIANARDAHHGGRYSAVHGHHAYSIAVHYPAVQFQAAQHLAPRPVIYHAGSIHRHHAPRYATRHYSRGEAHRHFDRHAHRSYHHWH